MILTECNIFNGIQEGDLAFNSKISSLRRNGLISNMDNYMVGGINTILLGDLGVFMMLLMETLRGVDVSVEEEVQDTS